MMKVMAPGDGKGGDTKNVGLGPKEANLNKNATTEGQLACESFQEVNLLNFKTRRAGSGELAEVQRVGKADSHISLTESEMSFIHDPGGGAPGGRLVNSNTSDECWLFIRRCCIAFAPICIRALRTTISRLVGRPDEQARGRGSGLAPRGQPDVPGRGNFAKSPEQSDHRRSHRRSGSVVVVSNRIILGVERQTHKSVSAGSIPRKFRFFGKSKRFNANVPQGSGKPKKSRKRRGGADAGVGKHYEGVPVSPRSFREYVQSY